MLEKIQKKKLYFFYFAFDIVNRPRQAVFARKVKEREQMGKRARGGRQSVFVRINERAPDPAYRKRINGNKTLLDYVWDFFSEKIAQAIKERNELLAQLRAKQ